MSRPRPSNGGNSQAPEYQPFQGEYLAGGTPCNTRMCRSRDGILMAEQLRGSMGRVIEPLESCGSLIDGQNVNLTNRFYKSLNDHNIYVLETNQERDAPTFLHNSNMPYVMLHKVVPNCEYDESNNVIFLPQGGATHTIAATTELLGVEPNYMRE